MHRLYLLLAATALLAACRGDGYLTVRGELLTPAPGVADCTVALPGMKDAPNAADFTRKVQGHFQESFSVGHRASEYEVVVACVGYAPLSRTFPLHQGEFAIDLGKVVLTPAS